MSGLKTTTAIVDAISTRHLLVLDYHGKTRTVEPHTFGLDRWGRALLCAYQIECESPTNNSLGWRFFFIEQMSNTRLDARRFMTPRPEYVRGDGVFRTITAEL